MKMRTALSIMASFLVIFVGGSISAVLLIFDEKVLIENKMENQIVLFENFVKVTEDAMILDDKLLLVDFCNMLKQTNPSISYILFKDRSGPILSSGKDEMIYFATRKLGKKGVKTRQGYLLRKVMGPQEDEIIDFSTNIKIDSRIVGTAQIGFSTAVIKEELASVLQKMRKTILYVATGAIIIGIFGSMLFAARIMRPIKQLAEGAARIGTGELNFRIPISSHDELGWLAGEFNAMGERLVELDQMKNEFISNVTHELRSPLGAIKSYVKILAKQDTASHAKQDYLGRIQSNVERLSTFIDNLLDVSRIEQGKMTFNMQPVSLHTVAGDVIKNFEAQAREKHIPIESKIPSVLPEVLADKSSLEQIFTNLISNALKFTSSQGKILIDAQEISKAHAPYFRENFIRVSVSDTGSGIAPNDLKRIFNKFEQARSDTSSAHHGTGLGLSIVKGIIEHHGGHIWVQSRLGKGTVFYFTLKTATKAGAQKVHT